MCEGIMQTVGEEREGEEEGERGRGGRKRGRERGREGERGKDDFTHH